MAQGSGGHGSGQVTAQGSAHGSAHGSGHAAADGAPAHRHGEMDIAEHRRMFDAFIKFWVWVFGATIAILIFLALFNS